MAYLKWPSNMKANLMPNVIVNINTFKSVKGLELFTYVPSWMRYRTMKVCITRPIQNEKGQWKMATCSVEVTIHPYLDDVIKEIAKYIRSIKKESGAYFDNHCFLSKLILDTDTMTAKTRWIL